MRIFSIEPNDKLTEYTQTPFQDSHDEKVLEDWLEDNPDGVLEDGKLLIIDRQVSTNLGGTIDLLGVDREGNVVVLELKRDRTPRETIAQSLEYASFANTLNYSHLEKILRMYREDESLVLSEYHREYFKLKDSAAVSFNKDQHVVIIGQRIPQETRQTVSFLNSKGLTLTCVEFAFFRDSRGNRLLSQEVVVGKQTGRPTRVASASRPIVTENEFLGSLDENGKALFSSLLDLARRRSMPIHWGTRGFSLNVDIHGRHVAVCFVYPPNSVYRQSLYTILNDSRMGVKGNGVPQETIDELRNQAEATRLFVPAGRELKCVIMKKMSEEEVASILAWCESVEKAIREHAVPIAAA